MTAYLDDGDRYDFLISSLQLPKNSVLVYRLDASPIQNELYALKFKSKCKYCFTNWKTNKSTSNTRNQDKRPDC